MNIVTKLHSSSDFYLGHIENLITAMKHAHGFVLPKLMCVVYAVNSPENVAMWNEIRSHYKRTLTVRT